MPPNGGLRRVGINYSVNFSDVCSCKTFITFSYLELYFITFVDEYSLKIVFVNKNILPKRTSNHEKTRVVEPWRLFGEVLGPFWSPGAPRPTKVRGTLVRWTPPLDLGTLFGTSGDLMIPKC